MSDYYPAGVTGNEDAFGPKAEHSEWRECTNDAEWVSRHSALYTAAELGRILLRVHTGSFQGLDSQLQELHAYVQGVLDTTNTFHADCDWEGTVDVAYWNRTSTWQCPKCGGDHEQDLYDEDGD